MHRRVITVIVSAMILVVFPTFGCLGFGVPLKFDATNIEDVSEFTRNFIERLHLEHKEYNFVLSQGSVHFNKPRKYCDTAFTITKIKLRECKSGGNSCIFVIECAKGAGSMTPIIISGGDAVSQDADIFQGIHGWRLSFHVSEGLTHVILTMESIRIEQEK